MLELRNQGRKYNELTKIQFRIGNRINRFNPGQIAKITNTTNTLQKPDTSTIANPLDYNQTQVIFKMLRKNNTLTDIVIKTGIDPEIVDNTFKQYIEFENKTTVPKSFIQNILRNMRRIDSKCNEYETVERLVNTCVGVFLLYRNFTYPCSKCDELMYLTQEEWPKVREFLINHKWSHVTCE